MFLIQYKYCIETRFSRCSSQEFAGITVFVWLIQLWICWHYLLTCQGNLSRGNFSRYVALIKPRFHRSSGVFFLMLHLWSQDFTGHQEFFICEKFPLLLYLFVFMYLYLLIYFKIVWPQVLSSQATCRSRRCYRNKEKGTVTSQKPNLCLWGTWKFSPKHLRTEKIPRQIIFISIKAFERYVTRFLKRCP